MCRNGARPEGREGPDHIPSLAQHTHVPQWSPPRRAGGTGDLATGRDLLDVAAMEPAPKGGRDLAEIVLNNDMML